MAAKEDFAGSLDKMKAAVMEMVESGVPLSDAAHAFKTFYARTAMEVKRGNKCQAARLIGTHRNTMSRILPPGLGPDARRRA